MRKTQVITIDNRKQNHTNEIFKLDSEEIEIVSKVKRLG